MKKKPEEPKKEILNDPSLWPRDARGRILPGFYPGISMTYSEEDKAAKKLQFLRAYAEIPNQTKALAAITLNDRTLKKWREEDPEFNDAVNAVKDSHSDEAEEWLHGIATGKKEAKKDQVTALFGWLNAKRAREFNPKLIGMGDGNSNVTFNIYLSAAPKLNDGKTLDIEGELLDDDGA